MLEEATFPCAVLQAAFELLMKFPSHATAHWANGGGDGQLQSAAQGSALPSKSPIQRTVLPFVERLLTLHMDKGQQEQLVQAWLPALHPSVLNCWQELLATCSNLQVMSERLCCCKIHLAETRLLTTPVNADE